MSDNRKLIDLISVGPATLADFLQLGITEVDQLIDKDATELFDQLQETKGMRVDRCCEDVFRTAIEQARNPDLPHEHCQWFFWSRVRKGLVRPPKP